MASYLDNNGLLYFWQKIKNLFVPATRKVNNKELSADISLTASDVGALPSSTTIPSPGTGSSYPAMDGTRSLGSAAGYARVDHVHPSDSTKVDKVNGKGLSANDFTDTLKDKLDGIATGATANTGTVTSVATGVGLTGGTITGSGTIKAKLKSETAATNDSATPTNTASRQYAVTPDKSGYLSVNVPWENTTYSDATTSASGLMSSSDKTKLNGIAAGAEVNQNAFSNVKVGSTTVAADGKTDTLELVAGSNVTLTPDVTNDKITIAATHPTYTAFEGLPSGNLEPDFGESFTISAIVQSTTGQVSGQGRIITIPETLASDSTRGLMSIPDKAKLDGIAIGAEVNQNAFSNVKVGSTTVAAATKTDTLELVAGSNVTITPDATNDTITIAATDTTYSAATTSSAGLMSSSDKIKLNGIASGAEVNQNAFDRVKVGSTTISADTKTDILTLEAGTNITLTPDATNDKVTIATSAEVNQNAFSNIHVGNTTISASSKTDTINLVAAGGAWIGTNATNKQISFGAPSPASDAPVMDGTAAVGTSDYYARGDHVHPSDTTRVPTSRTVNGKALSSNITLSASDVSAIPTSAKGAASGVCPLNASSKIDATYLPSYVDDVIEAYPRSGQTELSQNWLATGSASGTVITPETGKIYVLMSASSSYAANSQFRWGGSAYVLLQSGEGVSAITNAEIDTIVAS